MIHLLLTVLVALSSHARVEVPDADDPPVLRIEGEEIPRSVYRDWLMQQRGEFLVEAFVLRQRVLQLAREEGVLVPDEAIDAVVQREIDERIRGAFDGARERWLEELHASGRSEAGRRRERRIDLEVDRNLAAIVQRRNPIAEETLRAEWERLYGEGGRRLRARMLYRRFVLETVPGETREERRARRERELAALRDRVLAIRARATGGEDFVTLVRALSEDASTRAKDGLVADGLDLRGWSQEAVTAVAALADEEVSAPLFAKGGFWLVRSEGWSETPYASVREEIERRIRAQGPDNSAMGALRAELRAGARDTIQPAFLRRGGPEEVVLVVDGKRISRRVYEAFCAHYRGEHYTRRFAENWAILRAGREAGVVPTDEEVAARVEQSILRSIELKHEGDREDWLAKLHGAGRTEASYRRELADRELEWLVLERLLRLEREPTEAEVRGLWEREYGPAGRRIDARWIRCEPVRPELPPDADEATIREALDRALAEARREAEALLERLRAGEDFGALAREASDDPATAARGGSPAPGFLLEDWILRPDDLFGEVVAGRLVGPLMFEGAAWVFELLDVTTVPFESVREALRVRARTERPTELVLLEYRRTRIGDPVVEPLPALAEE